MGGKRIQPGDKFGKLTASELQYKQSSSGRMRPHWACFCDCGNQVLADSGNLRNGNTTQCGECSNESRRAKKTTHGMSASSPGYNKLYRTWAGMKQRCNDPNTTCFDRYGGAGVKVCERWNKFENFAEDMGQPPGPEYSIERIKNDRGYSPDNCKWIPVSEQSGNRRSNVTFEHHGKRQCLSAHCRDLDLPYHTIKARIARGWELVRAVETPIRELRK